MHLRCRNEIGAVISRRQGTDAQQTPLGKPHNLCYQKQTLVRVQSFKLWFQGTGSYTAHLYDAAVCGACKLLARCLVHVWPTDDGEVGALGGKRTVTHGERLVGGGGEGGAPQDNVGERVTGAKTGARGEGKTGMWLHLVNTA